MPASYGLALGAADDFIVVDFSNHRKAYRATWRKGAFRSDKQYKSGCSLFDHLVRLWCATWIAHLG